MVQRPKEVLTSPLSYASTGKDLSEKKKISVEIAMRYSKPDVIHAPKLDKYPLLHDADFPTLPYSIHQTTKKRLDEFS